MKPAILPLAFEMGASGSADFAVGPELPVSQAVATFRRAGEEAAALSLACGVAANVVQLRLTPEQTEALGAGAHSYQLDAVVAGQALRLAKGSATVAYGTRTAFSP